MAIEPSERRSVRGTRQRLIDAAVRVFARHGYHKATVDEIVSECGSSKGAFYFHFDGKEALFAGLLEEFADRLARAVEEAVRTAQEPGSARVAAAIRAALGLFAEYEDLSRVFLIEAVGVSPEMERRRRALFERFTALIQLYLEQASRRHRMTLGDSRLVAGALLGAINEVVIQWLSGPKRRPLVELEPDLTALVLRAAGWEAEG